MVQQYTFPERIGDTPEEEQELFIGDFPENQVEVESEADAFMRPSDIQVVIIVVFIRRI